MPRDQSSFLRKEIGQLTEKDVFRTVASSRWVSRALLGLKSGGWRLIVDLHTIHEYCRKRSMKMETLRRLRYIGKPNVHFVSSDLHDGFYAFSIHPKNTEAFAVKQG